MLFSDFYMRNNQATKKIVALIGQIELNIYDLSKKKYWKEEQK